MRVLVCGWLGSTNLGDELVFRGLLRALPRHAQVAAVSIDPTSTRTTHRVPAIDHRRLDHLVHAVRSADLVVLGGGGLIQDETSAFNLPYHLSRPGLAALAGTPWVGIGLGVGPLDTPAGRQLTRLLRTARAVTVRDEHSRRALSALGVTARATADTAFHLPPTPAPRPELKGDAPSVAVSLRPWNGQRNRLPVGVRGPGTAPWLVPEAAAALDRLQERTGARIRLVALQRDRDDELHARIAARMRHPVTRVVPDVDGVLHTLAAADIVVAMRYHAGIGATLAGRPSVLLGYSPKVDALSGQLGAGTIARGFDRSAVAALDDDVATLLDRREQAGRAVVAARATLRAAATGNSEVLHDALER